MNTEKYSEEQIEHFKRIRHIDKFKFVKIFGYRSFYDYAKKYKIKPKQFQTFLSLCQDINTKTIYGHRYRMLIPFPLFLLVPPGGGALRITIPIFLVLFYIGSMLDKNYCADLAYKKLQKIPPNKYLEMKTYVDKSEIVFVKK